MEISKLGITLLRELDEKDASILLGDTWWSGKHSHLIRRDFNYTNDHDGSGYAELDFPLALVKPNEENDRYDGTVVRARMVQYAMSKIDVPVHLLYGSRAKDRSEKYPYRKDGGHRISAARLRGDSHIRVIMQKSDLDRFVAMTLENLSKDIRSNRIKVS